MLKRLDTKIILVAVAAFLIVEIRATYLLFNLLELKNNTNFEVAGARQTKLILDFNEAIQRTAVDMASFEIAGDSRALAHAKSGLKQVHAALENLQSAGR